MKVKNVRFLLYDKWTDAPDYPQRPFKLASRSLISTKKYQKMLWLLRQQPAKEFLLWVKGDNYENTIIGMPDRLVEFMKDITSDFQLARRLPSSAVSKGV